MFNENEHPRDKSGQFTSKENEEKEQASKYLGVDLTNKRELNGKKIPIGIDAIKYRDTLSNSVHNIQQEQAIQKLKDAGFTDDEIKQLKEQYQEKQKESTNKWKELADKQKEYKIDKTFGDNLLNVRGENNPDYLWKHYQDNDNVQLTTNNISYWKNKDQYVMWVDNNKVVYLKSWQVQPIKQWNGGNYQNSYAVKLNRQYFKPYTTFTNNEMSFNKEDSFDDLVKTAKEQDTKQEYWKLGHYGE